MLVSFIKENKYIIIKALVAVFTVAMGILESKIAYLQELGIIIPAFSLLVISPFIID